MNAIAAVRDKTLLKESTLYVNLEPCSHHGKTPPCSRLIIEKGIPEIVIGTEDPNELVAGKGIEALEAAGRNLTTGILREECLHLNRRFFTFHREKRPYVILKWAQTRDGFIDKKRDIAEQGEINWITDEKTRTIVHKWRSEEPAILAGSETVLRDNPRLTVRDWPGRNPVRIIVDRRNRVTHNHNVMDDAAPTLIMSRQNKKEKNLEWIDLPTSGSLVPKILNLLYQRELQSVIVEGGAFTLNEFIRSGLWDEARVFTGEIDFGEGVNAPELDAEPSQEKNISGASLRIYYR